MRVTRSLFRQILAGSFLLLPLGFCGLTLADSAASGLFGHAEEQALRGELNAAIVTYREGLELTPENIPARVRLALLLRNASRRDEAIATLKSGIDLNGASAVLHVRLGELLEANDDPAKARRHYDTALTLEPDSLAGIDAAANLADIETRGTASADEPSISWSKGPKKRDTGIGMPLPGETAQGREFMQLDKNLSGEWCLEWTDRYRRDGDSCVAASEMADLDLKKFGAEVSFSVDPEKRTVSQSGLQTTIGMQLPTESARSIERALGNRTVVQTVMFDHSDFLEFTFGIGNQSRQCMQMTANRRGDERRQCASLYTFCRCAP